MFCARCGARLQVDDKQCPGCEADLWGSGAVRLTSVNEPAQHLSDVFPELVPAPEAVAPEPAAEPTKPRTRLVGPRTVAAPRGSVLQDEPSPVDVEESHTRRAEVALLVMGLLAVLLLVLVVRMVDRHIGQAGSPARTAVPVATATPTPKPTASATKAPATSHPPVVASTPTASATRQLTGTIPLGANRCANDVGAGEGTSCAFAKAVAAKVPTKPSERFTVQATSPVTGTSYTMRCTAAAITVCTGGKSAVVYVLR